jgi:uncharacterized membrane protein YhaH (DUF805 family)
MPSPQAGWYQDPQDQNSQRYWDGTQWTNQTQQAATPPPPPPGSYQAPTFQAPGVPSYQGYGTPQQGSYAAQPVSFPEAVKLLCTKWTTRGRASRSEYWFSALAFFVFNIATSLVNNIGSSAVSLITSLVSLAALLSLLFMAARRYHDSGKSGVWVLLQAVINMVSWVVVVVSVFGAALSAFGGSESDVNSFGAVAIVAGLILLANTVWAIVWLSLPGKPEKNKYDH